MRISAETLAKERDEILVVEWSNKKRIFGNNAEIGEMAKFKTKIKKNEDIEPQKNNT